MKLYVLIVAQYQEGLQIKNGDLPTGIFASGLVEVIQSKNTDKETICPHCGKDINKKYP